MPVANFTTLKNDFVKNNIIITNRSRQADIKQMEADIEDSKQLLSARMQENVLLKNQLADILKNNYHKCFLEEIEEFQTKFITDDQIINSLRKNVSEVDSLLSDEVFEDKLNEKHFRLKWKNLKADIQRTTIRFRNLKSEFDDFQKKIFRKREN